MARIRSSAAYGQRAGSPCTVKGLSARCTSPPTRRPNSAFRERTFNTSGPHATDVGFGNVLVTPLVAELQDSLDTHTENTHFLPDDICRHSSAQILNEQKHTAILREGEGVITHTLAPIKQ